MVESSPYSRPWLRLAAVALLLSWTGRVHGFAARSNTIGRSAVLQNGPAVTKSATVCRNDVNAAVAVEPPPGVFYGFHVARQAIPISVALIIGTFSILEILESLRELTERQLGHAHGITILAFLRLGRSVTFFKLLRSKKTALQMIHGGTKQTRNVWKVVRSKSFVKVVRSAAALQTQTEELEERVEELGHVVQLGAKSDHTAKHRTLQTAIMGFITSPGVAISAALLAVAACVAEIVDDMKPGAHHGAALLALSEFYYQLRRLKARVKKDRNRTSRWRASWMGRLYQRVPVGPLIAVAAAGYAGIEIVHDLQPGAHHGVAILAAAEFIENINRSRILHSLPQLPVAAATSTAIVPNSL